MNVLFPERSLVAARVMRSRDPWDSASASYRVWCPARRSLLTSSCNWSRIRILYLRLTEQSAAWRSRLASDLPRQQGTTVRGRKASR